MYGGQKTAFNFFYEVLAHFNGDARILVERNYTTSEVAKIKVQYPDWDIVSAGEQSQSKRQIVFLDLETRKRPLPVRRFDYFIFTYWTGAYAMSNYYRFQQDVYGCATPHLHLIQDFEPGFNAWSSEYMIADSLYHLPRTIAVFNSIELKEWFDLLGYQFESSYVFTPKLDPDIAKHIHDTPIPNREKLLIFYGRPNVARNCFTLIIEALNLLLQQHPEISDEWTILSIGSSIGKVTLSDGKQLQSTGKMSLEDYASLMRKAKVGVSLMCSPHPSYPPLEMAAFGINTITNSFVTKNLGNIPHITSLDSLTFQGLADAIWSAMNSTNQDTNNQYPPQYAHYVHYDEFFDGIIEPIVKELNADVLRQHTN